MGQFVFITEQRELFADFSTELKQYWSESDCIFIEKPELFRDTIHSLEPDLIYWHSGLDNKAAELVSRLKSNGWAGVPFILVVDNESGNVVKERAFKSGFDGFVNLPLIPVEWLLSAKTLLKLKTAVHESYHHEKLEQLIYSQTARLVDSENKFKRLAERSLNGIFSIDYLGRITFVNRAFCDISGYSSKEILWKDFRQFVTPWHRDVVFRNFEQRQRGEKVPASYEVDLLRKDQKVKRVIVSGDVVFDRNGNPITIGHLIDITEQRKAESDLRKAAERWSRSINAIRDGLMVMDNQRVIVDCNREVEKIFRLTREEIVGKRCDELHAHIHCSDARCPLVKVRKRKSRETVVRCFNGKTYQITIDPIYEEGGEVNGSVHLYTDITEQQWREKSQQALLTIARSKSTTLDDFIRRVSKVLAGFIGEVELCVAMTNPEKKHVLCRIGPVNSEISNDTCSIEDSLPGWVMMNCETLVLSGDEIVEFAAKNGRKLPCSGCSFWLGIPLMVGELAKGVMTVSANGLSAAFKERLDFFESVAREISLFLERLEYAQSLEKAKQEQETFNVELQRKNMAIEENNRRLNSLLNVARYEPGSVTDLLNKGLSEAVLLTASKHGVLLLYDEPTDRLRLHAVNSSDNKLSTRKDFSQARFKERGLWRKAVKTKRPVIWNASEDLNSGTARFPKGHVPVARVLAYPVLWNNRVVAVIGVANKEVAYSHHDTDALALLVDSVWKMVERFEFQKMLKQAKERAEQSDRLKTAFLHNLSHEVRTPLNGILGFMELLKEPILEEAEREKYLALIKRSGERLLNTMNDIIEIAKIEAGDVVVSPSEIQIQTFLRQFYHEFLPLAEEKGVAIAPVVVNTNLSHFRSDKAMLKSIFSNLIRNAIKFTQEGEIAWGVEEKEGRLEFFVRDTGVGIPEDRQKVIFDRFAQADLSITRGYEGAGIGLSIVKAYVEKLGGKLRLESEVGKGTCFRFFIPIKQKAEFSEKNTQVTFNEDRKMDFKTRILIAEDDDTGFLFLKTILKKVPCTIDRCITGEQAVDFCKKHPDVDIVLMDIKMPDMNGYEATKLIREFNSSVYIIAQTAFAMPGDEKLALDAGCDVYITKPIDRKKLLDIIETHIEVLKNKRS